MYILFRDGIIKENLPTYLIALCKYFYDEETGEEDNGIMAGTSFKDLPENYCCPLCEASKTGFQRIEKDLLYEQYS